VLSLTGGLLGLILAQWLIQLMRNGAPEDLGLGNALAPDVRSIVRALDADVPVLQLKSMSEVVADSLSQPRSIARFVSAFAGFALLLAAIGVYGIVAYSVRRRLPEMGIRMALGATSGEVVFLVLRKGALLSGAGVLAGLPVAFAVSTVLKSLLHGTGPHNPTVFFAVSAGLMAVTLAASYIPARRAAKVDPTAALRCE
jgi:putative ABC transport system permease protein